MDTQSLYASISPRYPELQGRVAIVTGSSRGIGRGIAIRLAREGMRVVINGRAPEPVETLVAELNDLGVEALAVPADVGCTEDVRRLFDETLRGFGTVDLLVNNAADLRREFFFDVDEALIDDELASNIKGPLMCSRRAAEVMRDAGGGSIVHISSVGGLRGHHRGLPYDATKGALDAITRVMGVELASQGIRVNAVAPGAIPTGTWRPLDDPYMQAVVGRIPMTRFGTPLEIGAVVAFLASDEAAYIAGQIIYVDGGVTAQLNSPLQPI